MQTICWKQICSAILKGENLNNNYIDYDSLTEITVKSQEELDMIPDNFKGRIYIEFGTFFSKAVINRSFVYASVVARGNSFVESRGNSFVVAWENSSVVARGNSSVVAFGYSFVEAWENSSVVAWGNSFVVARGDNSVVALENSSIVAWGNSSVEASGNTQVVNVQHTNGRIKITGNARVVYMPKTIEEYMAFYDIKHDKKTAVFYKAVHHSQYGYFSDYNPNFKYVVGEEVYEKCDPNRGNSFSYGIHVSHLNWALSFGSSWNDLAILELEVDINSIVIPYFTDGRMRTSKVKVLREVPLEECGTYGKILAKRHGKIHV